MATHFGHGRAVRYFCTDESRWGLKTLLGPVITARGVKPIASAQWPRENFWLYGACEPSSGEPFFYAFSHLDAHCFSRFVEQFSLAFPDTLNVLQLDQAGAHTAIDIQWPETVVPLFQPSHSPELNPLERLWQELRKRFKGKNFETLYQLQQALFDELNALTPQTVASLTGYPFILDALKI